MSRYVSHLLPLRILPPMHLARPGTFGSRSSAHLIERNARAYRHGWVFVVAGFVEPLFYLLTIGVGFGAIVGHVAGPSGHDTSFASYLAPGLLAISSMNGAVSDSTATVYFQLKFMRLYDSVLATPMTPGDVALGTIGWALIRGGLYGTSFLVVMLGMGLVHSSWAALSIPAALLTAFAFAGAGMAATTFMRSWQNMEFVTLATLPMFLFSTAFYPLSVYPRPIQLVVASTPLYQGIALQRGLTLGAVTPSVLWHVAYLAVMGLSGLVVASQRISRLVLS